MADRQQKVQMPNGAVVDGIEVAVDEATERWTDIRLADGTQLRLKSVVVGVVRLLGHYDGDGNPLYQLKANQIMTVSAPDHLRKGAGESKAH